MKENYHLDWIWAAASRAFTVKIWDADSFNSTTADIQS